MYPAAEEDTQWLDAYLVRQNAPPLPPTVDRVALAYVLKHAPGRREVRETREELHQLQLRIGTGKKAVTHPDVDGPTLVLRKAEARHNAALQANAAARKEVDERVGVVEVLQIELDRVREELARKRRVILLMRALQARERVRVERIGEVGRMIKVARKEVEVARIQNALSASPSALPHTAPSSSIRAPSRTRDALAALHARHITLKRSLPSSANLKMAIARSEGLDETDERLDALVEECKSTILKPRSPAPAPIQSPADVVKSIEEKEQALQHLLDLTTALAYSCDYRVKAHSAWKRTTLPALRASLEDSVLRARGGVGTMARSIRDDLQAGGKREEETAFEGEVRGALRLSRNISREALLGHIERLYTDAHERTQLVQDVRLEAPGELRGALDVQRSQSDTLVLGRLQELLAAARGGEQIMREIEGVRREVGMLVGSGLDRV